MPRASSRSSSRSPRWVAPRWTSSRTTSVSGCSPSRTWTRCASRSCGTPCGRARGSARTRGRRCARWGSWRDLGGVRPQGLRGAAAPRGHRHRGRRGPRARVRPLDLRRAAVDPHDHRAPRGDPGGDPAVSAAAWMAGAVGSLADNKAALGRRYAEWGVSAPTLESAVAAAAMAQDEMGHARSTYPVLKALGVDAGDEGLEGRGRRLAILDDELPDWMAFIAANLLIDGVLTTFVAACVDSSVTQMAQRARKILQEEGSHRVHAEAWAKRLCRAGSGQRDALVSRLLETWEHAGRWMGPAGDAGVRAAVELGMFGRDPAFQREQVRSWL